MADKYIIEGATYNGDGTTSAEAASAGAAGAWNHIDILTGTAVGFGSLAAGDTVRIRSKTSAGADIVITHTVSLTFGSAAATGAWPGWIKWVLDAGTVWPGINGKLTYRGTSTGYVSIASNNYVKCDVQDALVFENTQTAAASGAGFGLNAGIAENVLIDLSYATSSDGHWILFLGTTGTLINPHIKSSLRYQKLFGQQSYAHNVIINPDIELTLASELDPVFSCGSYAAMSVIGGQITGAGTTSNQAVCNLAGRGSRFNADGLKFPNTMKMGTGVNDNSSEGHFIASDDGPGAGIYAKWGEADSRDDGYYPYLNATLPNSISSGWSWKMYPSGVPPSLAARLKIIKLFTDTAAVKTFTLDFLLSTAFVGADFKDACYMIVSYIDDTTGLKKSVTSEIVDGGALESSVSTWSATTYGAISFNKKKVSVTTPTAVKKDTPVTIAFDVRAQSVSANDILFVDPDVTVS